MINNVAKDEDILSREKAVEIMKGKDENNKLIMNNTAEEEKKIYDKELLCLSKRSYKELSCNNIFLYR